MVDESDFPIRVKDENAFLKSFEDTFKEALLSHEAHHQALNLCWLDLVETGDEFIEESRFHDRWDFVAE